MNWQNVRNRTKKMVRSARKEEEKKKKKKSQAPKGLLAAPARQDRAVKTRVYGSCGMGFWRWMVWREGVVFFGVVVAKKGGF